MDLLLDINIAVDICAKREPFYRVADLALDDPERIRNRIENTKDQFYNEVYKKGVKIYAKQNICS